jgi:alpha-amylase/alpha-mannosidase (GH57 family)
MKMDIHKIQNVKKKNLKKEQVLWQLRSIEYILEKTIDILSKIIYSFRGDMLLGHCLLSAIS